MNKAFMRCDGVAYDAVLRALADMAARALNPVPQGSGKPSLGASALERT
jgi:hypothetical protein